MDFRFVFLRHNHGRLLWAETFQNSTSAVKIRQTTELASQFLLWSCVCTAPVQPSFTGCAIKTRKSRVQTMLRGLSPKLVKPVTGLTAQSPEARTGFCEVGLGSAFRWSSLSRPSLSLPMPSAASHASSATTSSLGRHCKQLPRLLFRVWSLGLCFRVPSTVLAGLYKVLT